MTFREFQCWLEGFEEGLEEKPPNKKQWALIKKKMGEVAEPVRLATTTFTQPYSYPTNPYPWKIWCSNNSEGNAGYIYNYTTTDLKFRNTGTTDAKLIS